MQTIKLYRVKYNNGTFQGRTYTATRDFLTLAKAYDPDHGRMLVGWRCSPDRAREVCAKTQKHFQGYLNQFAKAGYPTPVATL